MGQELEEYEKKKRHEDEAEHARRNAEKEKLRKKSKESSQMYDYEGEDVNMTASLSSLWGSHDLYVSSIPSMFNVRPGTALKDLFSFLIY